MKKSPLASSGIGPGLQQTQQRVTSCSITPRSNILSCMCIPTKLQQLDCFPIFKVHVNASDVIALCCYRLFYVVVNYEREEGAKTKGVRTCNQPGCCALLHLIDRDLDVPKEWQQHPIPNGRSQWMKDEHPPPPAVCRNNIMTPILQSLTLSCGSPFPRFETVEWARRESKSIRSVLILDSRHIFPFFFPSCCSVWRLENMLQKRLHAPVEHFLCTTNANLAAGAFCHQSDLPEYKPSEIKVIVIHSLFSESNETTKTRAYRQIVVKRKSRCWWTALSAINAKWDNHNKEPSSIFNLFFFHTCCQIHDCPPFQRK